MEPESGPLEEQSLERVLSSARSGDTAAFNTLVLLYQRQVFNLCYRTLGNSEDAADATQDALLNAFRALKSFQGSPTGLRAWLLRIAVNGCYDQLRRRQRRPAESLDAVGGGQPEAEPSAAHQLPDPGPGPEQASLSAEAALHIQQAIDRLQPDQRLTVILCDIQGLSYDEAALAMSVELGTVKSRLSRARAQLRELLTLPGEQGRPFQRLNQQNP